MGMEYSPERLAAIIWRKNLISREKTWKIGKRRQARLLTPEEMAKKIFGSR